MTLTRLSASKIGRLCLLEQSNAATGEPETYRMLSNSKGRVSAYDGYSARIVSAGQKPIGVFFIEDVDALARELRNGLKASHGSV
jgi:acetylglutamate synthase